MDILSVVSHGFIQRALVAGSFIAILCSILGVFLVLRRLSLIGDGLAHVTFGSVALGLFLNVLPLAAAIPIVLASSLGILKLTEKTRLYGDAAIGIVSSLGIALGVFFASIAGGFNIDLFSYLFGSILAIGKGEVITSIVLSVFLVCVIIFFYQDLFSITFDEETAHTSGVNTKMINSVIVMLTALTVVLAMRVVGIMLVSALIVLPPVTALQMSCGFRMTIILAAVISVISVVAGIIISFYGDLPAGAVIVILNFLFFISAFVYRGIRNK